MTHIKMRSGAGPGFSVWPPSVGADNGKALPREHLLEPHPSSFAGRAENPGPDYCDTSLRSSPRPDELHSLDLVCVFLNGALDIVAPNKRTNAQTLPSPLAAR